MSYREGEPVLNTPQKIVLTAAVGAEMLAGCATPAGPPTPVESGTVVDFLPAGTQLFEDPTLSHQCGELPTDVKRAPVTQKQQLNIPGGGQITADGILRKDLPLPGSVCEEDEDGTLWVKVAGSEIPVVVR